MKGPCFVLLSIETNGVEVGLTKRCCLCNTSLLIQSGHGGDFIFHVKKDNKLGYNDT